MALSISQIDTFSTAVVAGIENARGSVPTNYKRIARDISAQNTARYMQVPLSSTVPLLSKIKGGSMPQTEFSFGMSMAQNEEWGRQFTVKRIDLEDMAVGVYADQIEKIGSSIEQTIEAIVFSSFAAGITLFCNDGTPFLGTTHPVGSTTQSNYDSTGGGELWVLADLRNELNKPVQYGFLNQPTVIPPDKHKASTHHDFVIEAYMRGLFKYNDWASVYGSKNTLNIANIRAAMFNM